MRAWLLVLLFAAGCTRTYDDVVGTTDVEVRKLPGGSCVAIARNSQGIAITEVHCPAAEQPAEQPAQFNEAP